MPTLTANVETKNFTGEPLRSPVIKIVVSGLSDDQMRGIRKRFLEFNRPPKFTGEAMLGDRYTIETASTDNARAFGTVVTEEVAELDKHGTMSTINVACTEFTTMQQTVS